MITIVSEEFSIETDVFTGKLDQIYEELELRGSIVIKIGGEEESQALNSQYRKKDSPTDVLSFPLHEELPNGYYLGDIHICFPIAREQALEAGISLEQEMFTLMVHGLLHLAGYDHENDQGDMLSLQDKILKKHHLR